MFKEFDFIDFAFGIAILFLGIFGSIGLYKSLATGLEKSCVDYYLKNNYILEECDSYRVNLENLGE